MWSFPCPCWTVNIELLFASLKNCQTVANMSAHPQMTPYGIVIQNVKWSMNEWVLTYVDQIRFSALNGWCQYRASHVSGMCHFRCSMSNTTLLQTCQILFMCTFHLPRDQIKTKKTHKKQRKTNKTNPPKKPRRANAQQSKCHSYRTSLQSSSLQNQPLQMFGLQQNDCTSSSFPITYWPCVKGKVIHTEIIL